MAELFVGVMSGTSLDGVDAALVDFAAQPAQLVASRFLPYPQALRRETLALNKPGRNEIHRSALLANRLSELYAQAVAELLANAGISKTSPIAIGCHGQTVRHRPDLGFTVQLCNAALLAERTGARVVADFRSRDVAAGGHGAPLVPAFHAAMFAHPSYHRVVINIGGIANVTDLAPHHAVKGFDTGPGNLLMDAWAERHLGKRFDDAGAWASSGNVIEPLAAAMLADPYFSVPPPKSTGRDLFDLKWLARHAPALYAPADVQATLLAITVRSIAGAISRWCGEIDEALVCGGGAANPALMAGLRAALPKAQVADTSACGVPLDWVEAMAFAWLARETLAARPGNLPSVTGAAGARVLGAIYAP